MGAQTTSIKNIVNDLHVVLVLFSSSHDHISGSSSSLLLTNDPAWHIVFGGFRFFRMFHRNRSNPETTFKGIWCLFTADIFFIWGHSSHSLLTRYCARASSDGALLVFILLQWSRTRSELQTATKRHCVVSKDIPLEPISDFACSVICISRKYPSAFLQSIGLFRLAACLTWPPIHPPLIGVVNFVHSCTIA